MRVSLPPQAQRKRGGSLRGLCVLCGACGGERLTSSVVQILLELCKLIYLKLNKLSVP